MTKSTNSFWRVAVRILAVSLLMVPAGCGRAATSRAGDALVIGDISSGTGDAAFDAVLRQSAFAALQQSPHFLVVADQRIQRTMRSEKAPQEQPLAGDLAKTVCQRLGAKGWLGGVATPQGSGFALTLTATNCQTGGVLASQAITADSRDALIAKLGEAVAAIRGLLGEPAESIAKYSVPLAAITSSSMDALRAYALGNKTRVTVNDGTAAQFFARAVELDPNFALAWAKLGVTSASTGQIAAARQATAKAYDLRQHLSEFEREYITWNHAARVLRDDTLTREALAHIASTYPYDFAARNNFGVYFVGRGQFEQALTQYRAAAALAPDEPVPALNIAYTLLFLRQRDEAYQTIAQVLKAYPDPSVALTRWISAVLTDDPRAADFEQAATILAPPPQVLVARSSIALWRGQVAEFVRLQAELRGLAGAAKNEEAIATIDAGVRLARAAFEQGKAIDELKTSLTAATSPMVIAQAAAMLASIGQLDAAKGLLPKFETDAASSQPVLLSATITRAYVRAAEGQAQDAAKELESTLTEFPQAVELNYHLGRMRDAAGDVDGAIAAYRTVVQALPILGLSPAIAPARLYLSEALTKKGDAAGAKEQMDALRQQWKAADATLAWGKRLK